jgi:hypothetical protein
MISLVDGKYDINKLLVPNTVLYGGAECLGNSVTTESTIIIGRDGLDLPFVTLVPTTFFVVVLRSYR